MTDDEFCEALGGYRNPVWCALCSGSGEWRFEPDRSLLVDGVPLRGLDMMLVRLAFFDLDYIGILYLQRWDHAAPRPAWEYLLLVNSARTGWVPKVLTVFGHHPSFAQVGFEIDEWLALALRG